MMPAKATLALIVVLAGIMASEPVLAKGRGGGGKSGGAKSSGARSGSGHSHAHHATHARVVVGGVAFFPHYYYPPYSLPFEAAPAPWGYIEQGTDFYFCAEAQKSYPDLEECPGAWQLMTPVPVPGS